MTKHQRLVTAGLLLAALLTACGSTAETRLPSSRGELPLSDLKPQESIRELSSNRPKSRKDLTPVHWRLSSIRGPHEIVIESGKGYCVNNEPPPRYEAVSVREVGRSIYVTAFVKGALLHRSEICRDVGYVQVGTVVISQDLNAGVKLFDSLSSPADQRWPKENRGRQPKGN